MTDHWIAPEINDKRGPIRLQRTERQVFPLSLNQRDMWFQGQIHDQGALNNVCAQVTLSGPLRHELFLQAVQAVIDRHEALRTVFLELDGMPCQRILADVRVSYPIRDLSEHPPLARAAEVLKIEQEVVSAPLDFSGGPLFRANMLRLEENEHVFLFVFNHLILDGIYMAQFFQQVGTAYSILLNGRNPPPPSDIQYPDFAAWQEERLKQGSLSEHEVYWHQQLELPIPAMHLPTDRDSRVIRSFAVGVLEQEVPAEIFRVLKSFRKRYRTTLFRTVLAAFEVLMQRVVNEPEILLGIPFSTLAPHLPDLVGFFGHAVPVRANLRGMRFADVLTDVNRQLREAQANVEYPLCEAVRGLKVSRDLYRPLVPIIISQVRTLDADMGGVRMRLISRFVHSGVYHLWLTVLERVDGLSLGFYYNRELLEGRPLALLTDCMRELLSQVAQRPEANIGELEIMPEAEKTRVLSFGMGSLGTEEGLWVEELIAEHAREHPGSPAVADSTAELSYGELNKRANQLANWLRSSGIGPEDRVGILGRRGVGMLVTILGVLKAGAAYVPLDPGNPQERLLGMARDAGLKWLGVDGELAARGKALAAESGCGVFSWEDQTGAGAEDCGAVSNRAAEHGVVSYEEWSRNSAEEPALTRPREKNLAYVFYTSGSTGTPKGAMVERSGMLNHLKSKVEVLGLGRRDVVAQNASHCFDISVWQFLAALMVGGRVVIYEDELVMDPVALLKAVQQDGVTVLETVPSYLEILLGIEGLEQRLSGLRYLLSTAETLSVSLSQRWFERCPKVKLINAWGPTECSDDVTHEILESGMTKGKERVGVGKPISGARVYVVDSELRLVPVGCEGEIVVGGVCVGRGYLRNAPRTALSFVPDPFSREEGQRLYLTGDMGRWRWDGVLEFLGRRDGQIKVRGQRVEVGEVEGVLSGHPEIIQAVAEMKGNRLVGYWVGEAEIEPSELRKYMAQRLPEHMVPEAFVRIGKLPLTRNGKVDRQALAEPELTLGMEGEYIAPRTELEKQIAEVWQEVLGVGRIGIYDDFFNLGGHSLNATRIVLNLRSRLSNGIFIRHLFLNPTIAGLAVALEGDNSSVASAEAIPRLSDESIFPLSPAQKPMWLTFHQVLKREVAGWGFPQVIRIQGGIDLEALDAALQALIQRHELLRSSFVEIADEPGLVIQKDVEIVCPFHDLSSFEGATQEQQFHQLLVEQLTATIKNQPPLLRVQLVRFNSGKHSIVIQLPHIISDMWTERILAEDLAELYSSIVEKRTPLLPVLQVRYGDYAIWQNQRLGSTAMNAQRDYWLERFHDDFAILKLPGPGISEIGLGLAHERMLQLPKELMTRLRQLANDRGTTLFVAVLAIFTALLARLTDSLDVVVGTAVSGRTHPDLERVAGLFMNPLALRSDVSGDPGFPELLDRVSKTVLDAMIHQECPFQDWLRELRRRRGRGDLYPYSVVLFVEEATTDLRFAGAEAFLESPPAYDFDVTKVVGPTLALRISEGQENWYAELVPGLLQDSSVPAGLLPRWASFLRQVIERPEIRIGEFDLLADAEHGALAKFSPGLALDPKLLTLLHTFTSGTREGIAAFCGDGTIVLGTGEEWLDPFVLERFLLRREVKVLVVTGEMILRLKRSCQSDPQTALRALSHVILPDLTQDVHLVSRELACRVSAFTVLDNITGTLLWVDSELEPDMPFVGWPVGPAPVHIIDKWGAKVAIGMQGRLYVAGNSNQPGGGLIPLPWRGMWRKDGRLELAAASDLSDAPPIVEFQRSASTAYQAPPTALLRQIASVWQKVLHIDQVGIQDDFFALGGTAAKAVEISLQLGSLNLLALPVQITRERTIASLAAVVEKTTKLMPDETLLASGPAPLTPLQQFIFTASLEIPSLAVGHVVLHSKAPLEPALLSEALSQLALRHDALRIQFGSEGKLRFAEIGPTGDTRLEQIDLTPLTFGQRRLQWQAMVENQSVAISSSHPSLRAILGHGGYGKGHKLALIASSMVVDEASWPVLIGDLEHIYNALLSGKSALYEKGPSFYAWLLAADRLTVFAEAKEAPALSRPAQMEMPQMARWSVGGAAHRRMKRFSPLEQEAAFLAAARATFVPWKVGIEYDRRGSATGQLPDLTRTVGQFGCLTHAQEDPDVNFLHPTVWARLLASTPHAHEKPLFRLVHFSPAGFPVTAPGVRILGFNSGRMLHLTACSAGDMEPKPGRALKMLGLEFCRETLSVDPVPPAGARHFDTVDFDLKELEELLN